MRLTKKNPKFNNLQKKWNRLFEDLSILKSEPKTGRGKVDFMVGEAIKETLEPEIGAMKKKSIRQPRDIIRFVKENIVFPIDEYGVLDDRNLDERLDIINMMIGVQTERKDLAKDIIEEVGSKFASGADFYFRNSFEFYDKFIRILNFIDLKRSDRGDIAYKMFDTSLLGPDSDKSYDKLKWHSILEGYITLKKVGVKIFKDTEISVGSDVKLRCSYDAIKNWLVFTEYEFYNQEEKKIYFGAVYWW